MPSQKQLRWSELKVGVTVIFASVTLAVLTFLMTGSGGLFVRKIKIKAYFDDAGGIREGAPVRLQGVDLGNVVGVRVVPNRGLTPVEVSMKVTTKYDFSLRKDSKASLATAGVLGETFVNISSADAKGPPIEDGDTLATTVQPDLSDVMRASQSTLQNLQTLETRLDHILSYIESGQGSVGKLVFDDSLYKQVSTTVTEFGTLVNQIAAGKGAVGKLVMSDELYDKAGSAVDKLNSLLDQVNSGQGSIGKLVKDPELYNNVNKTVAETNRLISDFNAGKGAIGKLAKDENFARKLENTVTKLSDLMDKINSGPGSAAKFVNDPAFYNNTNQLLVDTRELIKAFRENPKKYLTIQLKIF